MRASCEVCGKPFKKNHDYRRCCSRACAAARLGTKEERFWSHVEKSDGCWLWTGELAGKGYGRMKFAGVREHAHRMSWEFANGPVQAGLLVLHKCDTPACVRPDHLFLGTQKDNMRDMHAKGRAVQVRGEQHGRAKLTEEQARQLLAEYRAGGVTQKELADRYGLHPVYVNKMIKGHKWAHLQAG